MSILKPAAALTVILAGLAVTGPFLPALAPHLPKLASWIEPAEANAPPAAAPQAAPAPAARPPAITVTSAERRTLADALIVTGSLIPREEVVVGVDIEGLRIMALEVDQGDRVKAGQIIARLQSDTIETQIAQNESNLARADAAIAQAKSNIVSSTATQEEAAAALERARPLREKGVIGQDVFEQRTSVARVAAARLAAAKNALELAEADRGVILAQRREVELRKAKTEIKAPTDGVILVRNARIGAVASGQGEPLFRIARDGKIELEAEVPEASLLRLREGQAVEVAPAGSARPIRGEVRLVSPQVDSVNRLGKVRIALPADAALRSGSFARGRIEIDTREGVTLPLSAVMSERGKTTIQVVKDGKIETRKVVTGISGEGRIEIVEGLEAGETVVLKAGAFVRNGDVVTPVAAKAEEVEG